MEKSWLSYALAVCLLVSAGIVFNHYIKYQRTYQQHILKLKELSQLKLYYVSRELMALERQVFSTAYQLAQSERLLRFVAEENDDDRQALWQSWGQVLQYQPYLKQIRYVSLTGQERLKISLDEDGVTINTVQPLEDIVDRHYFTYIAGLPSGRIVSSAIELTGLNGQHQLTQHIALPFMSQGVRRGYLFLDLEFWLSPDPLSIGDAQEIQTYMLTRQGDYLLHPEESGQHSFQQPKRQRLSLLNSRPQLWKYMNRMNEGDVLVQGDLFVFRKISLPKVGEFWLLSHISQKAIKQQMRDTLTSVIQRGALLISLLFAVIFSAAYLFAHYRRQTLDSKLALAALNGMSAVVICDRNYLMLKVNREFENITGYTERQIRYGNARKLLFDRTDVAGGTSLWDKVAYEEFWEGELKVRGRAGIELTSITRVQAVKNSAGQIDNYIISIVDISERKELEEQLRYQSERDGLTQLWNRRKFEHELKNQTMLRERYPESHISCLALVDIDHFKRVNDEKGHDEGDRVIKQVASILLRTTRRTDYVARIGGEEFAILMPHTDLAEAQLVLERIRQQVSAEPVPVTISIGYTDLSSDSTQSYKRADIALYESKSLGRNRTSVCNSADDFA